MKIEEQLKRMDDEIRRMNWRRLVASLQHYNIDQLTELKRQIDMTMQNKEQIAQQHK